MIVYYKIYNLIYIHQTRSYTVIFYLSQKSDLFLLLLQKYPLVYAENVIRN